MGLGRNQCQREPLDYLLAGLSFPVGLVRGPVAISGESLGPCALARAAGAEMTGSAC